MKPRIKLYKHTEYGYIVLYNKKAYLANEGFTFANMADMIDRINSKAESVLGAEVGIEDIVDFVGDKLAEVDPDFLLDVYGV